MALIPSNPYQRYPDVVPDLPSSVFPLLGSSTSGPTEVTLDRSSADRVFPNATPTFGVPNPRALPEANISVNNKWFVDHQARKEYDIGVADYVFVNCNAPKMVTKSNFQRYDWKAVRSWNAYFKSEEGRQKFGRDKTCKSIQEFLRFAGIQVTNPLKDHSNDAIETLHFAKRARVANMFIYNTKRIGNVCVGAPKKGDRLFFIFRRYRLGENDNTKLDISSDHTDGLNKNHIRWNAMKRKRLLEEGEEEGKQEQPMSKKTKRGSPSNNNNNKTLLDKIQLKIPGYEEEEEEEETSDICPYYWRIDPYHHRTQPSLFDYVSFHPRDGYIGWVIPVGFILEFLTKIGPDLTGKYQERSRKAIYEGEKGYESIKSYTKLPHMEIFVRC